MRALAVGCALVFVAVVATLHVLRPDVDPVRDDLSRYAVGPHGWLMAIAFVAMGGAATATACSLRSGSPVGRRVLAVAGLGGALVAVFPTAAVVPVTPRDYAEVAASLVFFVGFAAGSGVLSRTAWTGSRRLVPTLLSAGFDACFLAMLFAPDSIHGLAMRIAIGFLIAWLVVAALF